MTNNIITAYFEADHDRLDRLFSQFQAAKRVDFPKAKPFFRNFRQGLRRHILWEEEILFPVFEEKSGVGRDAGPTAVMRREHRMIEEMLEAVHDKVRAADPESDDEERALLEVLGAHNNKEENVLYPAIDGLVSDKEAAGIFVRMEEVPPERWQNCCKHHEPSAPADIAGVSRG